jgi:phospholipase C
MGPIIGGIRESNHAPDDTGDPIKHVVVLMFENHSFDQMLGCFKSLYPELEGVDPAKPFSNKDSTGHVYFQRESNDTVVSPDPMHELGHILNSLKDGNGGFVSEYQREYPKTTTEQRQRIMDYFGIGDLPALHQLASHFTICDHWYSSVPGPTWTNRFFVHSGTSVGRVKMPGGWDQNPLLYAGYDQDTIYDRFTDKDISWKIYHGDVPQSLVLSHQQTIANSARYEWLDQFFEDATGPENGFPAYSFIEPNYLHIPYEPPQNDDHPPHSTLPAQALLGRVYNALRKNVDLWNSTLLVVLYDENGGFYDHVSPPGAVPPDEEGRDDWTFDRMGVRVPALLISPWVKPGVLSTTFDHTSLLKYLTDKWGLGPLTARVAQAQTFADAIRTSGQPRTDTPESVAAPVMAMAGPPGAEEQPEEMNENQKALVEFSKHLAKKTATPSAPPRAVAAAAGPGGEAQAAKQRVREFLAERKLMSGGP